MRRLIGAVAPAGLILLLLAGWEVACRVWQVPAYVLPPPTAVAQAFAADWKSLAGSAWNTLAMALQALLAASLFAQLAALAAALSQTVHRALRPLAVILQVTPVIAIAPLVNIWAGIDHPARAIVAMAAVVAFFPIFSGAVTGLKSADPDLERLFDLYEANRWQRLARLRLPSALPFLMEGHKVAAGLAIVGTVVAEFVAGSGEAQGLAWRILDASHRLQTARMLAALFALGLLGAALYALFEALERQGLKWWRGR